MASIQDIEAEIIEEFELFDDWMQKYEYIIDLGKELAVLDEQYKTEDNLVKGCQSRVWLTSQNTNGSIEFLADSDALITKGIVSLLVRVLSNQAPQAIVDAPLNFIETIGLKAHLSPNRANGLVSMIKKMKAYALANL